MIKLFNKYILNVLFVLLLSLNSFAQGFTNPVTYFEDFNGIGIPTNIPANSYWSYHNEIDPTQNSWDDFIPGDGNAYITVDTDTSNDLDDVHPFQSITFFGAGENHRLEVRMKGAVVDGGLVSFLFTYEQEGSIFNEVDLELVANDTRVDTHATLPANGGWTDARYNTWGNANEITNVPFTGTKKAIINGLNDKISLIDDQFHTYTIDWRSNQIDFFIDGVLQETLTTSIATGKAKVIFGFRDLPWAGDFNWSGTHTMVVDYLKIEPLDNVLFATDDNYAMIEGETLEIRPLTKGSDDRDPNDLDLSIFSIAGVEVDYNALPQTITVEESGNVVGSVVVSDNDLIFTPSALTLGAVTFPYVIKNTNAESATGNQIIVVNAISLLGGPTATDDFYTMEQGETLLVRPITKAIDDSDPGNLDLSVFSIAGEEIEYNALPQTIAIEQAGNVVGTITVSSSGQVIFTPSALTLGTVTFPYVIKNTIAESATANEIIEVNAVVSGPTATDDIYTMDQGESLLIRPLTKAVDDSDSGNLDLSVFSISGEEIDYNALPQTITVEQVGNVVGTVIVSSDEILFTPLALTTGTVTFPYVIKNTIDESATGNQIIEINALPSLGGPVATDDVYTMDQGETLLIRPLTKAVNDSDPNHLDLSVFSIAGEEVDYNSLPQTIVIEQGGNVVGTVVVSAYEILFIPSVLTSGTVTFPYVIKNTIDESATANQIIEVNGISSSGGPTATDDSYTMNQGETLLIRPLTLGVNDSDPGNLDLSIFSIAGEEVDDNALPQTITVEQAGNVIGTVTVSSTDILFTPSALITGTVTFPYVIKNTIGESATANEIIEVNGMSSSGPTATDDSYTMDQGGTLLIRPLTKSTDDSDPNNLDLSIFSIAGEEVDYNALPQTIIVEQAGVAIGTVIVSIDEILFTPSALISGTVTFPYVIKNTAGESATANEIIEVNGISSSGGPIATDDSYTMDQGGVLLIRPLTKGVNDSDPGNLDLSIFSIAGEEVDYNALPQIITVEQAGNVVGTVRISASVNVTFTPSAITSGTVTFPYIIKNTIAESSTANQIIEVNGISSSGGPTATDDSYTMNQGETLLIRPLTKGVNDSDPSNLDLSIFSIAGEEVDYNALPQIITVEQAGNIVGTVRISASVNVTFTPSALTSGTVTFPYVIKNTIDESATANEIIEVNGISSAGGPIATDDSYTMDQGETLLIRPLTKGVNDSDPGNLDLTVFSIAGEEVDYNALPQTIVVEQAGNVVGTVTIVSSVNVTFTSSALTTGTVTFAYIIKNTIGESATANQIIEIDGLSSSVGPTATDDNYTMDQGDTLIIRPLTKSTDDSDPNNLDLIIFSIAGEEVDYNALPQTIVVEQAGDVLGTVIVSLDEITFTPLNTITGTLTFAYVIKNTIDESATANQVVEILYSITGLGNPIAVDDTYFLEQGSSAVIKPLTRFYDDYDPNGLAISMTHIGGEEVTGGAQDILITNATISINENNDITFIPDPSFSGTLVFPYIIENTNGQTATGLVHMIVDAMSMSSAAPQAVDDVYTIVQNTRKRIAPLTYGNNDVDPNGESLRLAYINGEEVYGGNQIIEVPNGRLQVYSEDDITFIPDTDYLGVAMFSYEISNTTGISDTGLQTIEIVPSTTLSTDAFVLSEANFITYPNPSKGDVHVRLNSNLNTNATITLSDVTGKTIYSIQAALNQGENSLDFNFKVSPGIMFLRITSNNQSVTKKLIFKE